MADRSLIRRMPFTVSTLFVLGYQSLRRLLAPRILDQPSDASSGDTAELDLESEEASPRIPASDGLAGCRIIRGGAHCLLLADTEDRGCRILAQAGECPAPHLELRNAKPEMASFLDLRQRDRPAPNVLRRDQGDFSEVRDATPGRPGDSAIPTPACNLVSRALGAIERDLGLRPRRAYVVAAVVAEDALP